MDYIQLNPFDTEPLYRQLKNAIKNAIISNRLCHDESLPSENTLISLFDVSSTVVKAAYKALEQEGLIKRIRGKGTFVNYPKIITINLPFVHASNQDIEFNAINISALILEKTSPIFDYFPHAKSIAKIRRLVKTNGKLTTYQEVYLPNQSRDTLNDLVVSKKKLKEIIISNADDAKKGKWINRHGMKKATYIEANFLNIPIGFPLIKIASTIYDQKNLLALVFTFIRGDMVNFRYDRRI